MNILLVYPEYPETFWSFKHALKFIFKKAAIPPLGLLTVASMLPREWNTKLVDMNVTHLMDEDLEWADYVFLSAMSVQKHSVKEVIERCNKAGVSVVAGGPLFTTGYEDFEGVDHFVLNEAEITLPLFLEDLRKGEAKPIYTTTQWANKRKTPIPRWELIDMKNYATMNIQYSRGCSFNCEFCDITLLYGRLSRTKEKKQLIGELESLYRHGWRGGVFFVDDNFISNKKKLKEEILPAITEWMEERRHPFTFITQASINLSDDEELLMMMVRAGFDTVFIGIETPNEDSLTECTKVQNKNRDLIACVKKIQNFGLQVQGGFIVGFDNDPVSIFERQIRFIQNSGIVTAMVGLLNALKGTRLYQRLEKENRLIRDVTGDNTDCSINFIPKMNYDTLISGYKRIISTIYSPSHYYERVKTFLKEYNPLQKKLFHFQPAYILTLLKSILYLGVIGKERVHYWKLFLWTIFRRPRLFSLAITLAIYGSHFRKVFEKYI
jgi:radical SAM superfamily enzyme YgiQ (UPF0313 family)